jgi:parallel beta-helix repeat protein
VRNLYVPEVYPSIGAALSAAAPGQAIIVGAGTHTVTTNLVLDNVSLELKPGVQLRFSGNRRLEIKNGGKLIAHGTSSDRITIRGSSTSAGSWAGIVLNGAEGSSIQYTDILHANEAVKIDNTNSVSLSNVNVERYVWRGIDVWNSSPQMFGVHLDGTYADGAGSSISLRFAGGSGGSFKNGSVKNTADGNSIVITGNSDPLIQGNSILNNAYEGIRLVSNSGYFPEIIQNTIENSNPWPYGIYLYSSAALIRENVI